MGTRSTVKGFWRQGGRSGSNVSTPAAVASSLEVTFDAALANTTATGKFLPAGANIVRVDIVSAHTGGTTPAMDIGTAAAPDGIINGATSTANIGIGLASLGTLTAASIAADVEITAGDDGTGTAGTGNVTAWITYIMSDDGSRNN